MAKRPTMADARRAARAKEAGPAPGAGKKRAEFWRGDGVGLEAGRMGRRLRGWIPTRVHVNTLISQSGLTTLARARFLDRNNGYAKSARISYSANTVGNGLKLSWKSPLKDTSAAEDQKGAVHEIWNDWAPYAGAEGESLDGLQKIVANEVFVSGECFIRKRPRKLTDGLPVPLQLQVLPSEMLPTFLTMPLENGNIIRQGIEFDKIGRRVAYHFWRNHPGDSTVLPKYGERIRITADQILHVYDPQEAGQIRALPELTPSIVPLWMLDIYDDAELDRKKTAALVGLFVKRPDPDGEFFEKALAKGSVGGPSVGDVEPRGAQDIQLEPGVAHVLFPGEDIATMLPAESGHSYDPFQYRTLTRICAGIGQPYAAVTWDLVKANYSNMRAALIEARRRTETVQRNCFVHRMCRGVLKWWTDAAHIAGALNFEDYAENPAPYFRAAWMCPRWVWLDPEKDAYGEILLIDAGLKARSETIEESGRDPVEVDRRIATDKNRADELGITISGTKSVRSEVAEAPTDSSENAVGGPTDDNSDAAAQQDEQRLGGIRRKASRRAAERTRVN